MIQQTDGQIVRPIYNGVSIRIRKPEINTGTQTNTLINDNGVYNAVNIDIDNPTINPAKPDPIYNYPNNKELIPYNIFAPQRCCPSDMFFAYNTTTNILMPKIEAEVENKINNNNNSSKNNKTKQQEKKFSTLSTPNYVELNKTPKNNFEINEAENKTLIQRPEIIPAEEIKPEVDIQQVLNNLNSNDFDTQALQMEEIVKTSFQDKKKAENYIVRDVFENLINILNKDTTLLEAPTPEQLEIRNKYMHNSLIEDENNNSETMQQQAFNLSEKEIMEAKELTPLELAERNKEYAIASITVLSKIYSDGVEKTSGNIIPMTELPGVSDIIDVLRVNPNPDIKIDAINALQYIQRPEYKDELSTLYSLATNDNNAEVAMTAQRALDNLEKQAN